MRNARLTVCFGLLLSVVIAAEVFAAPAVAAPKSATCVAPAANAKVEWTSATATSARVYFHSANAKQESYVEMRRAAGGRFWAVLPKAASGTTSIDYRILAADKPGSFALRSSGRIAVTASCARPKMSAEENAFAANLVVGTASDAAPVPIGFRCDGIAAYVSAKGDLVPYDACHQARRAEIAAGDEDGPTVNASRTAAPATAKPSTATATNTSRISAPSASALGSGVAVPYHHLRPHRAPNPVTPPKPRLTPVSPSQPAPPGP